jgi:N-sulfoglucosamine sulfohydrolase
MFALDFKPYKALSLIALSIACLGRTLSSAQPSGPLAASQSEPLNFLFIIADDCTFSDLEIYGGQAKTPHLKQLAREGMLFERCFQAAPMCSPTRHCLYTGLYPVRSGAHPNHTYVQPGTRSIAHYLKEAGYRVALSGKTHIQPRSSFPFEYSNDRTGPSGAGNPDMAAIDRIVDQCHESKTPFAIFACSNEPHTPHNRGDPKAYPPEALELPPLFVDTPQTREAFSRYLAEVSYFDGQVGQCLEILKRHDLEDQTLVMVVSEQGNSFPFAKWTCYDKGLQSGMVVRWPKIVQPGSISGAIVEYVDILPTFLDAAGVNRPDELDGRSFLPVLLGNSQHHKTFSYGLQTSRGINDGPSYYGIRSVRSEHFRYIRNLSPETGFRNTMMKSNWWQSWEKAASSGQSHAQAMVRRFQYRPAEELYHTTLDPWNLHNLADDPNHQSIKDSHAKALKAWMEAQGDEGQATELQALDRQWKRASLNQSQGK